MSKRKLKQYCKSNELELWEKPYDGGWTVWIQDGLFVSYAEHHMHKNIAYANLWRTVSKQDADAARRLV